MTPGAGRILIPLQYHFILYYNAVVPYYSNVIVTQNSKCNSITLIPENLEPYLGILCRRSKLQTMRSRVVEGRFEAEAGILKMPDPERPKYPNIEGS